MLPLKLAIFLMYYITNQILPTMRTTIAVLLGYHVKASLRDSVHRARIANH